jgi:hypothetical protein
MCNDREECPLGKLILKQWDWLLSRGYARKGTDSDSEEYVLALMIARHLRWKGLRILETFALALEEANYHKECGVVRGLIQSLKRKKP